MIRVAQQHKRLSVNLLGEESLEAETCAQIEAFQGVALPWARDPPDLLIDSENY